MARELIEYPRKSSLVVTPDTPMRDIQNLLRVEGFTGSEFLREFLRLSGESSFPMLKGLRGA